MTGFIARLRWLLFGGPIPSKQVVNWNWSLDTNGCVGTAKVTVVQNFPTGHDRLTKAQIESRAKGTAHRICREMERARARS